MDISSLPDRFYVSCKTTEQVRFVLRRLFELGFESVYSHNSIPSHIESDVTAYECACMPGRDGSLHVSSIYRTIYTVKMGVVKEIPIERLWGVQ